MEQISLSRAVDYDLTEFTFLYLVLYLPTGIKEKKKNLITCSCAEITRAQISELNQDVICIYDGYVVKYIL